MKAVSGSIGQVPWKERAAAALLKAPVEVRGHGFKHGVR